MFRRFLLVKNKDLFLLQYNKNLKFYKTSDSFNKDTSYVKYSSYNLKANKNEVEKKKYDDSKKKNEENTNATATANNKIKSHKTNVLSLFKDTNSQFNSVTEGGNKKGERKKGSVNSQINQVSIISSFENTDKTIQDYIKMFEEILKQLEKDVSLKETLLNDAKLNKYAQHVSSSIPLLSNQQLITFIELLHKLFPTELDKLNLTEKIANNLNIDELSKYIFFMRKAKEKHASQLITKLRENIGELSDLKSILYALRIFQADSKIISEINEKILELGNKLKYNDWLELINTKSILRQREQSILESCSYHLVSNRNKHSVEDIKKLFLSFGILHYENELLFKQLIGDLKTHINNNDKGLKDEFILNAIILSLGMLRLRDEELIENIYKYLVDNSIKSSTILANFFISCGYLNYLPDSFRKNNTFGLINLNDFNISKHKDCITLLNLAWASCVCDLENTNLVKTVLSESFYKLLIDQQQPNKESTISLIKLLHINLYALTSIKDYDGSTLPDEINILEHQNEIILRDNKLSSVLLSTLSNFITKDKYFKHNLLMPCGLLIDALIITNKSGEAKALDNFYNPETLEFEVDQKKHFKTAIKLINYKDMTLLTKKLNGFSSLQLKLLKSLGYLTIPITYQELLPDSNVIDRIKMIQEKLVRYSCNEKVHENFI